MARTWKIEATTSDKTFESYAHRIIGEQFREMMLHQAGAKVGADIVYVHDMRVASRRLREAMDNFAYCLPKKPFKAYYKQVKAITRTLGAVRDLDVLITRFEKALPVLSNVEQCDVRELIAHLEQKREVARKPMSALFAKLAEADFEKKFLSSLAAIPHVNPHLDADSESRKPSEAKAWRENLLAHACRILPGKVEDVYVWEPFIYDASRGEELHKMRISIKRLRYCMEFFAKIYESAEFVAVVIGLQRQLGSLHDCDVVLDLLTDYQKTRSPFPLPGIATLLERTCAMREADYETFLKKWQQLAATQFKQKLLATFISNTSQKEEES